VNACAGGPKNGRGTAIGVPTETLDWGPQPIESWLSATQGRIDEQGEVAGGGKSRKVGSKGGTGHALSADTCHAERCQGRPLRFVLLLSLSLREFDFGAVWKLTLNITTDTYFSQKKFISCIAHFNQIINFFSICQA